MLNQRIQYGRCSFVVPDGFVIHEAASLQIASPSECSHCIGEGKAPVSITLTRTPFDLGVPDFSENPEDMIPEAYPSSITLMTHTAFRSHDPELHLQETCHVLQGNLKGFKLHFCERDNVGEHPAARSQYSFQSNFRIYYLNMAWTVDGEYLISTLSVTQSGVTKGWDPLRRFSESVKL